MSNDLFFSYASSIDGSGANGHVLVDDSPVDVLKLQKKEEEEEKRGEKEEKEGGGGGGGGWGAKERRHHCR